MSIQQSLARTAPVIRSVWEDDDFQARIRSAGEGARATLAKRRRGAPPPTVLQRAGMTLAEAGRALTAAAGASGAPPVKRRRGRTVVPAVLLLGGVAAFYALKPSAADSPTPQSRSEV